MTETEQYVKRVGPRIARELRLHAPFTALGATTGIAIMALLMMATLTRSTSNTLFWTFHPMHVVLSAFATTAMFCRNTSRDLRRAIMIGLVGSIGIATLSDSVVPFLGELLLDLPNREIHIGFIEKWWLVNPLAFLGIALGWWRPHTRLPHAGHVLLSTWASLFHMTMAMDSDVTLPVALLIGVFLFLAVWLPCCTSDIVFPLLFAKYSRIDDSMARVGDSDSECKKPAETALQPSNPLGDAPIVDELL